MKAGTVHSETCESCISLQAQQTTSFLLSVPDTAGSLWCFLVLKAQNVPPFATTFRCQKIAYQGHVVGIAKLEVSLGSVALLAIDDLLEALLKLIGAAEDNRRFNVLAV